MDYAEAKQGGTPGPWSMPTTKKAARLNIISHLLDIVPDRQQRFYERPPIDSQTWVPARYVTR